MAGPVQPPRAVGLLGASLMPVNGMVGSGIFAVPALVYAGVGDFAPWMFAGVALMFFPVVWCFARLAGRFDRSGGPQLYAQAAYGPFLGFQAGWMRYASSAAANAGNTHVMISYLAAMFPVLDGPVARPVSVLVIIWTIAAINWSGMRNAVGTLGAISVLKFLPILALVVGGFAFSGAEIRFALPEFSAAESVLLLVFYTFMGFEGLVMSAGEVKDPRKTIPGVLVASIAATALLYMAVQWAYIGVGVSGTAEDDMPLATMAQALAGPWAATAIALTAAVSICASTLEGGINTPRLSYAMAENGLLPRVMAHVSPRHGTPDVSILFLAAFQSAFALSGAFAFLAVASTLSRIVMYALVAMALPVIRRREVAAGEGGWRAADVVMPALALVCCIWIGVQASADAFVTLGLTVAGGTLLYLLARRRPRDVEPARAGGREV